MLRFGQPNRKTTGGWGRSGEGESPRSIQYVSHSTAYPLYVANARVAEADAPSHHYNRSKPRKLLAIQQGGIIGIASESKGRDI